MTDQGKSYDLIAQAFADLRDSFYKEQKYLDLFISYLPEQAHILDVGCGSGYPIAAYLMQKGFVVTGLDASEKLLAIAKNKFPQLKTLYGDMRSIELEEKYDGILEWWALFHVPQEDQLPMLARFASWLKPGGILEFTTGDRAYNDKSSAMLNQELFFYSLDPKVYEQALIANGFEILLCEPDQEQHLVWVARYRG